MSSLRKDIITAYLAAGSKVASWVIVSAVMYRSDERFYAILILLRGTIGLLNYTAPGLAPALIHLLTAARKKNGDQATGQMNQNRVLDYSTHFQPDPAEVVLASGIWAGYLTVVLGVVLSMILSMSFEVFFKVPPGFDAPPNSYMDGVRECVLALGAGTAVRLFSDLLGAMLQTEGLIALDNLFLVTGEIAWVVLVLLIPCDSSEQQLKWIGAAFLFSSGIPLTLRWLKVRLVVMPFQARPSLISGAVIHGLLAFGSLVALAQMADFLYAPTDFILINRFLSNLDLAAYGPAVQIDAGLLLLVSGVAAVLLPRTALAHAADDHQTIRNYYIRGTIGSTAVLAAAALAVWGSAPWLLKIWLKFPLSLTFTILPMVLIHTVVGGSSAVGRSILLGLGKVKPFTAAVLIAGVSNVLLSFAFVRYAHLGLTGIVLGTIIAVVGRCAVWMPWYVLRTLKRVKTTDFTDETGTVSPPIP